MPEHIPVPEIDFKALEKAQQDHVQAAQEATDAQRIEELAQRQAKESLKDLTDLSLERAKLGLALKDDGYNQKTHEVLRTDVENHSLTLNDLTQEEESLMQRGTLLKETIEKIEQIVEGASDIAPIILEKLAEAKSAFSLLKTEYNSTNTQSESIKEKLRQLKDSEASYGSRLAEIEKAELKINALLESPEVMGALYDEAHRENEQRGALVNRLSESLYVTGRQGDAPLGEARREFCSLLLNRFLQEELDRLGKSSISEIDTQAIAEGATSISESAYEITNRKNKTRDGQQLKSEHLIGIYLRTLLDSNNSGQGTPDVQLINQLVNNLTAFNVRTIQNFGVPREEAYSSDEQKREVIIAHIGMLNTVQANVKGSSIKGSYYPTAYRENGMGELTNIRTGGAITELQNQYKIYVSTQGALIPREWENDPKKQAAIQEQQEIFDQSFTESRAQAIEVRRSMHEGLTKERAEYQAATETLQERVALSNQGRTLAEQNPKAADEFRELSQQILNVQGKIERLQENLNDYDTEIEELNGPLKFLARRRVQNSRQEAELELLDFEQQKINLQRTSNTLEETLRVIDIFKQESYNEKSAYSTPFNPKAARPASIQLREYKDAIQRVTYQIEHLEEEAPELISSSLEDKQD